MTCCSLGFLVTRHLPRVRPWMIGLSLACASAAVLALVPTQVATLAAGGVVVLLRLLFFGAFIGAAIRIFSHRRGTH